jgi:hypothetical protein
LIGFSEATSRIRSKTAPNGVREKANFVSGIMLIWVVQICAQKYSSFGKSEIVGIFPPFRCPQEGRFAIVTNVGCGMRWTR